MKFVLLINVKKANISAIVCAGAILRESTCLLRHITTEKSGVCQYAVCIAQNTLLKKVAITEWL